eukprot:6667768-Pyramimonas_sp.AAC.2
MAKPAPPQLSPVDSLFDRAVDPDSESGNFENEFESTAHSQRYNNGKGALNTRRSPSPFLTALSSSPLSPTALPLGLGRSFRSFPRPFPRQDVLSVSISCGDFGAVGPDSSRSQVAPGGWSPRTRWRSWPTPQPRG